VAIAAAEPSSWRPSHQLRIATVALAERVARGLAKRRNWTQLLRFGLVGTSGYFVNLGIYAYVLQQGAHFRAAAVASFMVAVVNNYLLNRQWTFRDTRGHVAYQGLRFLAVAVVVLVANVAVLSLLVALGAGKVPAQAVAIVLVMPLNFAGNKLWTFRRPHGVV
jgi:putative flippase GtrA